MKIGYISDVHIEFTSKNSNLKKDDLIKNLKSEIKTSGIEILLSSGDISHNIKDVLNFYKTLNELNIPIYLVLGNHDVWNWDYTHKSIDNKTYDKIIDYYKKEFNILNNVHFLECNSYKIDDKTYIIGSTGFAKYNNFNANSGMYRGKIDRLQEVEMGTKWEDLYLKFFHKINDESKLIVLTHMPVTDWCKNAEINLDSKNNVYYFNGHDHYYKNPPTSRDTDRHNYRNAQTGYYNKTIKLGISMI